MNPEQATALLQLMQQMVDKLDMIAESFRTLATCVVEEQRVNTVLNPAYLRVK